jgi:hypothetical protein
MKYYLKSYEQHKLPNRNFFFWDQKGNDIKGLFRSRAIYYTKEMHMSGPKFVSIGFELWVTWGRMAGGEAIGHVP